MFFLFNLFALASAALDFSEANAITRCASPRHYVYALKPGEVKSLTCTYNAVSIFDVHVPDRGHALARAKMRFRNLNPSAIYYWSAGIIVGDGAIPFNVGDDICPQTTTDTKKILGYGDLDSSNGSRVRVVATQGSAPCTDGQVESLSDAVLDVWVEDPHPDCVGRDIGMVSTYQTLGLQATFDWSNSFSQILSLPIPYTPDRDQTVIFSSVEGSADLNPNSRCGYESEFLESALVLNNKELLTSNSALMPASQGMGHALVSSEYLLEGVVPVRSISLQVRSPMYTTPVRTGGCCGDAKLGFVRLEYASQATVHDF
ncbi:MAG: hypothetical protein AB7G93_07830 [Bdellovibrionales bacterium]